MPKCPHCEHELKDLGNSIYTCETPYCPLWGLSGDKKLLDRYKQEFDLFEGGRPSKAPEFGKREYIKPISKEAFERYKKMLDLKLKEIEIGQTAMKSLGIKGKAPYLIKPSEYLEREFQRWKKYFEAVAEQVKDPKLAANWIMVEVLRVVNEQNTDISDFSITPKMLAELLQSLESRIISGKIAKDVFDRMAASGERATDIIARNGLEQITDRDALRITIKDILGTHKDQVQAYKQGKKGLFDFFVGQVMKKTRGRANPELVNEILREQLDE